jgi:hypothetical protein
MMGHGRRARKPPEVRVAGSAAGELRMAETAHEMVVDQPGERRAIAVALAQDRDPRQAGLRALEAEQLEEPMGVVDRLPLAS